MKRANDNLFCIKFKFDVTTTIIILQNLLKANITLAGASLQMMPNFDSNGE